MVRLYAYLISSFLMRTEEEEELVVEGGLLDIDVVVIELVDEELEEDVVIVGEKELFEGDFGELIMKDDLEVVEAVAEKILVNAEDLTLKADEGVHQINGQQSIRDQIPCKYDG